LVASPLGDALLPVPEPACSFRKAHGRNRIGNSLSFEKQARLIDGRKDGRWMYYRLADDDAPRAAHDALRWTLQTLKGDKRLRDDAKRLKQILAMDPEVLCSQQRDRTLVDLSECSSCAPKTPAGAR
jgi:DNA-binding transcriptional ArsR family regulator